MAFFCEKVIQPVILVGIGNRLKGDDAAGPEVIDRLRGQCSLAAYDAGTTPENLLGPLCRLRPKTVVLIDAVCFSDRPGMIRWFESNELAEVDISTHSMSPKLLIDTLRRRSGAAVYLLGIQPRQTAFGQPPSAECRQAVEILSHFLLERFPATKASEMEIRRSE